ncbi:MAG: PorV/PorQ family protein, partial [bacterium]
MFKKTIFVLLCALVIFQASGGQAHAQLRASASYLKVLPGSEQQGIAGALSGTLDHFFAVYANPGATGLSREWQLSASYTTWIPDIYHATLVYSKGLRLPWNERSRFALGISYLGIKDFDSSNGRTPFASGGDLLVTASLGQPIRAISDNLSLGGSVKYLRSRLDRFDANTVVFDLGLLFRTGRFKLRKSDSGFFRDGIFSAGLSLTQLGAPLDFITEETPLPRTLRAGAGLHLGAHEGLQMHLSAEYRSVRDEQDYWSVGAEFAWSYFATIRAGYSFEKDNVLRHFAAGASFRFDDIKNLLFNPGRSRAFRLNTVKLQQNIFFTSPYSGTVNYYPIGPEYFDFIAPMHGEVVQADSVKLQWEYSRDPDLFDGVRYWLLVDQDSLKLVKALDSFVEQPREAFFGLKENASFLFNDTLSTSSVQLHDLRAMRQNQQAQVLPEVQDYFWTVIAFDKDRHYRFIDKKDQSISRFRLTLPDLRIRITQTWLDTLSTQAGGMAHAFARILAENRGAGPARNFAIAMYDLPAEGTHLVAGKAVANNIARTEVATLHELPAGADSALTVRFMMQDAHANLHYIRAFIDDRGAVFESRENNNTDNADLPVGHDLSLHKRANIDTLRTGEPIKYTLSLSNHGPAAARAFSLTDVLPPGVDLV